MASSMSPTTTAEMPPHDAVAKHSAIPPRYARRIESGLASPNYEFDSLLETGGGLYIFGERGTGKTELACRIAYAYVAKRLRMVGNGGLGDGIWVWRPLSDGKKRSVRFRTSADMMTELRGTYATKGGSEQDVVRRYAECSLLVLDDLGKGDSTRWGVSKLFQVINERYNEERATIVTTQYEPAKLAAVLAEDSHREDAEAIVSRLMEMCRALKLDGGDRRTRMFGALDRNGATQ